MTNMTRRAVLRGTVATLPLAGAAIVPLAHVAAEDLDAELLALDREPHGASDAGPEMLALQREWWEARVAHDIALDAESDAQEWYYAEKKRLRFPAVPARFDDLPFGPGDVDDDGIRRIKLGELRTIIKSSGFGYLTPDHPFVVWAREVLPEAEATHAAITSLKDTTGLRAAEEVSGEALDRLDDVERRIREAPARTLGDLVLKALLVERNSEIGGEDGVALAEAVLAFAGPDLCRRVHLSALGSCPEARP